MLRSGRRAYTLEQVADELQTDVRTVRKLIRIQREEDLEALTAGRPARRLGLRAKQLSERLTRITEAEIAAYLLA